MASDFDGSIRESVSTALDAYSSEAGDFISDVAARVATRTVEKLLGLIPSEGKFLRDWSNRLNSAVGFEFLEFEGENIEKQKLLVAALHVELNELLIDARNRSIAGSGTTIFNYLRHKNIDVAEQLALANSIAFAGNHTSSIMLGNAAWMLCEQGSSWTDHFQNDRAVDVALTEMLRYKPVFRGVQRKATRPGKIGDVTFLAGDYAIAWIASGNRDEDAFDFPDRMDLARSSRPSLGFGHGIHFCIGHLLARHHLRVFVEIARQRNLNFDLRAKPIAVTDPWVDGFDSLPLALRRER